MVCVTKHVQNTQNKKFAYLWKISRKIWGMKLIFCLQIKTKVSSNMIVSLWVYVTRHAESTQKNKFASQGKREGWSWFFPCRYTSKVFSTWYDHFRCVSPGMPKLPETTSLLFLCNILRKKWVMTLISTCR